jgi:putative flippase GtrA
MKTQNMVLQVQGIIKKVVNRETISYTVAGVLTTIVNFATYEGLYIMGIPNLTANAIAWLVAVTFAYVVNKINVFESKSHSLTDELAKITKFFGARLVTLGIEQLGMYIFIDRLGFQHLLVKAAIAVIVIILNYVFSKLYIFNTKQDH